MNPIGIHPQQATNLTDQLNGLLASYQVHYQNLRAFHWDVKGERFFELHERFELLYDAANIAVDDIAERILTLGGTPLHSFQDYLNNSDVQPAVQLTDGGEMLTLTITGLNALLALERKILELAGEAGDEGTVTLISDLIKVQEKDAWMLTAANQ